ncbi:MAG TPA: SCO family protein [Steroidobacteraceae bacterium]|nr:SCO family protein [Steroidobacteraceae bacterium]
MRLLSNPRITSCALVFAGALVLATSQLWADEAAGGPAGSGSPAGSGGLAGAGGPAHHHSATATIAKYTAEYAPPAVELIRDDGKSVWLPQELDDGRPVLLNFIFTSCSSVCPLASQTFAQFQRKLGAESKTVHLMSISIDPEEDTPARLAEYAKKFGASPQWQHYTGTLAASLAAQRAFDVYRGEKMSHTPVTLLRSAPGKPWLRIDGFVTPDELLHEYRNLLASK